MYRCLNVETLGITGRQSELIELALTYRFKGLDVDMESFARQVEKRGRDHATRYFDSAQKCAGLNVGTWALPVRWRADEAAFKSDLQRLPAMASVAKAIGATRCYTIVMPGSDSLPLKENFDFHSARLSEIADLLAPHEIRLGLGFQAAAKSRKDLPHQFIVTADAICTLVDMVRSPQVGLLVDTWNWFLGGGKLGDVIKVKDKIVAIRAAGLPDGATADSIDPKQRLLPSLEGSIPFADMLLQLSEGGFDGPVIPYPHISQFKGVTRDKIVQMTSEALRSVWPGTEPIDEEETAGVDVMEEIDDELAVEASEEEASV